jgi:hypothetical protein
MRYRKLDANGDYSFGNQQADFYIDTPAGVAQAVQTRLSLLTGEWFLDVTDGTPWRTEVLGKYTQNAYDAVIKDRILSTQVTTNQLVMAAAVTSVTAYSSSFDPNTRKLTVIATIQTIYGETQIATTL